MQFSLVSIQLLTQHLRITASGVDAVGEAVMCVDVLPQPNGEHKINVKGEQTEQITASLVVVFLFFGKRCLTLSSSCGSQ